MYSQEWQATSNWTSNTQAYINSRFYITVVKSTFSVINNGSYSVRSLWLLGHCIFLPFPVRFYTSEFFGYLPMFFFCLEHSVFSPHTSEVRHTSEEIHEKSGLLSDSMERIWPKMTKYNAAQWLRSGCCEFKTSVFSSRTWMVEGNQSS